MKITYKQFQDCVKELRLMFSSHQNRGSVEVTEIQETKKALVTITTKDMLLETHKEAKYFHGAILKCDNYSLKAEEGNLVIVFGFVWA
ncbi:hypothetical protein CVD28_03425 [Bacillus sp. M6-12]|uniref:hypothetical protein n=1 Tax=Bacillus sp. M6-12 TaxID=2054166 RepID=UPI000C787C72|nr:hypothetical protein [Bacillus sp. M6-12]PLS19480.1 hypothetical protein CVD28_03425 [Bacillus sp. M6-12]